MTTGQAGILGHLRAGVLFYLLGTITALQIAFLMETYFPLDISYFWKSMVVLVGIPAIITGLGFRLKGTRRRAIRRVWLALEESGEKSHENAWKRFDWLVIAVVMFTVWSAGYGITAYLTADKPHHTLLMELDGLAPFEPTWIWLYFALYPVFLVPLVMPYPKRLATTVMLSYITVMSVIYAIFLAFPVSQVRPLLEVTNFSTWALSLIYAGDTAGNCFPSSHCAMSLMAALVLLQIHRGLGAWGLVIAVGIGASTLFIKQHFVLDVAGGWGITLIVYYAFFKGRIIDVLDETGRSVRHRLEAAIEGRLDRIETAVEGRLEDVVRKVVREELERALTPREPPEQPPTAPSGTPENEPEPRSDPSRVDPSRPSR